MKQFMTIFKFEFSNYGKNKTFIAVTVVLMLAIAVVLSWPRVAPLFDKTQTSSPQEAATVAYADPSGAYQGSAGQTLRAGLEKKLNIIFETVTVDEAALKTDVQNGKYDSAVIVTSPNAYTHIVKDTGLYDEFDSVFISALKSAYRVQKLSAIGVTAADIEEINMAPVELNTVQTAGGTDQSQNFIYTYILIFALYMAVLMYGQFVATSVATEKSTRAMELLITSTKPRNLMFGKVFGAGAAGIAQMVLIFGTAYVFYNLNSAYYAGIPMIQSIFGMPLSILLYTVLFFLLGFFIYAFLFGAAGSLVSRMEELSAAVMPVTLIFVAAFLMVMMSMASGNVETPIMIVCSYIPLTSPMAMFVRIAMGSPAPWEIALSVGILVVSTGLIGMGAAAVYRLGVLLYGKPPKAGELIKMLKLAGK